MKRFLLLFSVLLLGTSFAAELADPNEFPRTIGTHIGVIGGIPNRSNNINVTNYNVSGSSTETTGDITSGTNSLVVASATSFSQGQGIIVGKKSITTVTVTGGATQAGNLVIYLGLDNGFYTSVCTVALTGSETTAQVAAAIRASSANGYAISGSGNDAVFTCLSVGPRFAASTGSNNTGCTVSYANTQTGVVAVRTTISSISGTTFTLGANASATVDDGTVAHDDSPGMQAAINAAASGDAVYIPAGTYQMYSTLSLKTGVTLRGAGVGSTILNFRNTEGYVINANEDSDYGWAQQASAYPAASSNNLVTTRPMKGATSIVIGNTTDFAAGDPIQLAIYNQQDDTYIEAGSVIPFHVYGFNTLRRPMHRVTSVTNSTTLAISPPVLFDVDDNLPVYVNLLRTYKENVGIESLHIRGEDGPSKYGISFQQVYNFWVTNVKITGYYNYSLSVSDCINGEIRTVDIDSPVASGTNRAGILWNHGCNSLIEDCFVVGAQPPLEMNFSATGNVIAYNFFYTPTYANIVDNHSAHQSHNLFEGNIAVSAGQDGYFGSSSNATYFRNWLHGTVWETSTYPGAIFWNRWTRYYSFQGNIFGTSGYTPTATFYNQGYPPGGSPTEGLVKPTTGDFWRDWNTLATLTTRTSDTAGTFTRSSGSGQIAYDTYPIFYVPTATPAASPVEIQGTAQSGAAITFTYSTSTLPALNTEVKLFFNVLGYLEIDRDANATWFPTYPGLTEVVGNYEAWSSSQSIPAAQSLGASTLPDSRYTTKAAMESRGVVWGNLTFPPIDPTSPGTLTEAGQQRIPAAYRYFNDGANPPSGAPAYTPGRLRKIRR